MPGSDLAARLRDWGFSKAKSHMSALDDYEVVQAQGPPGRQRHFPARRERGGRRQGRRDRRPDRSSQDEEAPGGRRRARRPRGAWGQDGSPRPPSRNGRQGRDSGRAAGRGPPTAHASQGSATSAPEVQTGGQPSKAPTTPVQALAAPRPARPRPARPRPLRKRRTRVLPLAPGRRCPRNRTPSTPTGSPARSPVGNKSDATAVPKEGRGRRPQPRPPRASRLPPAKPAQWSERRTGRLSKPGPEQHRSAAEAPARRRPAPPKLDPDIGAAPKTKGHAPAAPPSAAKGGAVVPPSARTSSGSTEASSQAARELVLLRGRPPKAPRPPSSKSKTAPSRSGLRCHSPRPSGRQGGPDRVAQLARATSWGSSTPRPSSTAERRRRTESRRLQSSDDVAPDVRPTFGRGGGKVGAGAGAAARQLTAAELREKEQGRFLRRNRAGPAGAADARGGGGRSADVTDSPSPGATR